MCQLEGLNSYVHCLKLQDAIGEPVFIILSDASELAYGFLAYIHWQVESQKFWCRIILAKTKIAPL